MKIVQLKSNVNAAIPDSNPDQWNVRIRTKGTFGNERALSRKLRVPGKPIQMIWHVSRILYSMRYQTL